MEVRHQATKGIIEGDHIKLLEPVPFADGTLVEMTITVPNGNEEARERQRRLLRKGIHLGGPPYPNQDSMSDRVLVDTNIFVYAYDADAGEERTKAEAVVDPLWDQSTGVLPTQVLAEFFITITHRVKQPLSLTDAKQIIEDYRAAWSVFATTPDTILLAIDGVERHRLSFWDAMIWASAVINAVPKIYSEDMQHGQMIEGVRIETPLLT